MNLDQFLQQRRPAWTKLSTSVDRMVRRGARRVTPSEVHEMLHLYREASADLARLRAARASSAEIEPLNRLIVRAHGAIYRTPHGERGGVLRFFTKTYPSLVRRTWRFSLCSLLISIMFACMAYVTVQSSPDVVADIMGGGEGEWQGKKSTEEIRGRFQVVPSPILSGFVTANNVRVAFLAFALGITYGIGTLYVLAINGTMLGAFAGAYGQSGIGREFWLTVLPHGALELSAIVVAGGSGLMVGYALWCPGLRTRRRALREEALVAVKLVLGLVPAFVVAGIIEGFITPSRLPDEAKMAIGVVAALTFCGYCFLAGREQR